MGFDRQERADSTAGASVPAVELIGITKTFPGVVANDDIHLAVRAGEVHCLLGENGAGKSTLMSVLSGMTQPDAGRIRVGGRDVGIDSPRSALGLGIGMVYQHSTLVPALSVLENLLLGEGGGVRLDTAGGVARLTELAATLGVQVDPAALAGDLSLGEQQQVEIIKALWRGSNVLILDEPTSMLTPEGVVELQKVLVRLKEAGVALVFITHKLHEATSIGDRVTILKQGRVAGTLGEDHLRSHTREELQAEIVRIMFGEEAGATAPVAELEGELPERREATHVSGDVLLELVGVTAGGDGTSSGIQDVSLVLRQGEILGVAGVDGNGQRELAEVVAGQRRATAGDVRLFGAPIGKLDVRSRQKLGLRYVTDDRLGEGIVGSLGVGLNLVLKRIGEQPFWKRGRIQRGEIAREGRALVAQFDVRTPSVETRAGTLSGGNIQKVLLARELSSGPKVVVFNKPTYGLDIRTTLTVRERIQELAAGGVASLVISTDLEELLGLCDRIAVLYQGRLVGTFDNGPGAAERIGELMVGSRAV
ncbi:MAG: ral nucleoside transport system ATP-binding protein [Gaiellales bacterium]|nr:ral nucleoside transport system ATP-binding protein [Gaiellales bacterium]